MTYRIAGLRYADFAPYFAMDAAQLAKANAMRMTADSDRGFPCRVSLDDAAAGEDLILLNYISHDVANPYRSRYAIFVREGAPEYAAPVDCLPPVFGGRNLSLRGFGEDGLLVDARLALAGTADEAIRALFAEERIAYIHAHYAAYGCFAARVDRHEEGEAS